MLIEQKGQKVLRIKKRPCKRSVLKIASKNLSES